MESPIRPDAGHGLSRGPRAACPASRFCAMVRALAPQVPVGVGPAAPLANCPRTGPLARPQAAAGHCGAAWRLAPALAPALAPVLALAPFRARRAPSPRAGRTQRARRVAQGHRCDGGRAPDSGCSADGQPVSFAAAGGEEVRLLALVCGRRADDDRLVGLCRAPGAAVWRRLELSRGSGAWAGEGVELQRADEELAEALLPAAARLSPECAPGWPGAVLGALDPWPLRGRGTIVFDGSFFLSSAAELVGPGSGPLLLPGGAALLGLPTSAPGCAAELEGTFGPGGSAGGSLARALAPNFGFGSGGIPYGALLEESEAAGQGLVDLSRCRAEGLRRQVRLEGWPFGLEFVPRTWSRGAAVRDMEPEGVADLAGCRLGDVVVSANGEPILDRPLAEVGRALRAKELVLEVEQPLIESPMYLREAPALALRELGGPAAERAGLELLPRLEELLAEEGGCRLLPAESRPLVFAGDGGTSSRLHTDQEARVQFCHVLHGVKLLSVQTDGDATEGEGGAPAAREAFLDADLPLPEAEREWLCGAGVSVAAGRPGDILCFWGGDRHGGTNAVAAGPCIALFHSCRKAESEAAQGS